MDKSLTIDALKALKVGDWVYITPRNEYGMISICDKFLLLYVLGGTATKLNYDNYGTKWLAYKNKEQAENAGYGDIKQAVKEFAEKLINQFNFSQDDFGFFVEVYNPAEIRLKINNLITELYGEVKE